MSTRFSRADILFSRVFWYSLVILAVSSVIVKIRAQMSIIMITDKDIMTKIIQFGMSFIDELLNKTECSTKTTPKDTVIAIRTKNPNARNTSLISLGVTPRSIIILLFSRLKIFSLTHLIEANNANMIAEAKIDMCHKVQNSVSMKCKKAVMWLLP